MKLYRYSPIESKEQLQDVVAYLHAVCHELCSDIFGEYLPVTGNIGIFCHYPEEYERLVAIRNQLTEPSDDPKQKYFKLLEPITINSDDTPTATYTHLYIRQPDPYRSQVGDVDFHVPEEKYDALRATVQNGAVVGARLFPRDDLDMLELVNPDVDALGYVSSNTIDDVAEIMLMKGVNS